LGSAGAFAQEIVKKDTWWLPPNASLEGRQVDWLFDLIFVVTGVLFVAVEVLLVYFLIKYRHRKDRKATFLHGHHQAEVIWTATPALILVIMGILSIRVWGQMRLDRPDPLKQKITEIEVLAQQFQWNIRYPGKDGKFGTRDDIGTFDPSGATDPIEAQKTPEVGFIHVPVNQMVRVHLMSRDVLHSFFLPNMRTKMDAVPGLRGELWFTPTQVGRYDLACAELCGPQHYTMKGDLIVHTPEEYDAWLKGKYEEIAQIIGEEAPAKEETPATEPSEEKSAPKEEPATQPATEESK